MNLTGIRNVSILIIVLAVAIAGLSFLGTVVASVVPVAITAVIAFILGRLSARVSLREIFGSLIRREAPARSDTKPASAEQVAPATRPLAAARPAEPVRQPVEAPPIKNTELLDPDFEIKTPEQVEAEARAREAEAMKRAPESADSVAAALEERRKRLLGGRS